MSHVVRSQGEHMTMMSAHCLDSRRAEMRYWRLEKTVFAEIAATDIIAGMLAAWNVQFRIARAQAVYQRRI